MIILQPETYAMSLSFASWKEEKTREKVPRRDFPPGGVHPEIFGGGARSVS